MTEVNRNGVKALVTQEKRNPFLRVRIPYKGTQQQKQPLHDALVDSAKAAGITPLQMAIYTNFFLEQVGEQMIRGRIVRIPGFGLFGPRTRFRYVRGAKAGDRRICYPAFRAANTLKSEIRMRVRPALRPETDAMRAKDHHVPTSRSLPESMQDVRARFYNFNHARKNIRKETRIKPDTQAI